MAITTLDGLVAGFQPPRYFSKVLSGTVVTGRHHSFWGFAGVPGAGSYDTTLNGVTLTSPQSGQIPFTNPGGGTASYLARFAGNINGTTGILYLADRIWHNGGLDITSTGAQSITSPTWPARDVNGNTIGEGILLGVEVSSATGAGTPTLTASYTNTGSTSGRSAVNIRTTVATSIAGTFHPLTLQAGDTGVSSVQSLTLSATWTSGTINLVAYRLLAQVEVPVTGNCTAVDAITGGLPQMYSGSVPFLIMLPAGTTTSTINGQTLTANG